jgi:hypothetical protein
MAVPVVVIKVAVSFSKTPVVTTVVVGKVTVAALEFSYVTFGKITATHVRSVPHAMWSISTHGAGSSAAHRVRSTTAYSKASTAATASHVCATTASATEVCATAPSAPAPTSTTMGYKGQIALVTWKRWNAR